jgi:hypothetical protein
MFLRWILFWTVQSEEEWRYVGEKRRYREMVEFEW